MWAPDFIAEELLHPNEPDEPDSDAPPKKLNLPLSPAGQPDPVDSEDRPCWIVVAEEAQFLTTGFLILGPETGD